MVTANATIARITKDRATQAPALQALAVRDEARPDKDKSAKADADGKPTRQERGPHGPQGALIEVARQPERQGRERNEHQSGNEALRRTNGSGTRWSDVS